MLVARTMDRAEQYSLLGHNLSPDDVLVVSAKASYSLSSEY